MSHWFHRNPLKATGLQNFEIKMFAHDSDALKIVSDLKQSRARVLELLPDPHHTIDQVETALKLYLALARGLLLQPGEATAASKLRTSLTFRWSDSLLGSTMSQADAVFEVGSILMNTGFWFMKHAAMLAAKKEISMEEAKEVHTSLKKAAGVVKFVQETLLPQLLEKGADGGDLDGRVTTAYINQCTAEAQEVTIARAIELQHNPTLVSALAHETSKMFTTAADNLHTLDQKTFGHWRAYFEMKSQFYLSYAYSYQGEALLAEDKCGDAIRCLQESKTCLGKASDMATEYAKTKGPGTTARPEKHTFFRRLAPIVQRTLEKCERENGFIYHQKVPYDPVQLPTNAATHGLVAPEVWEIPQVSPLWTAMAYAAFDDSKLGENEKDGKGKSKAKKEEKGDLKPVKEVPIEENEEGTKNESGCVLS